MIECKNCGSISTIPILYGKPTPELFNASERGLCKLGGCAFEPNVPTRFCLDCKYEWDEEGLLENEGHGYFIILMYESGSHSLTAVKKHVRISREIDLDNAEVLADAIILKLVRDDGDLMSLFELPHRVGDELGGWQRRLAQGGGIDQLSSGVQATYFSPNGALVSFLAYYNAEWMDEY